MTLTLRACVLAGLVWALSACGSSAAVVDGGGAGLAVEAACGSLAEARCSRIDACTGGTGSRRRFGDRATCLAQERGACSLAQTAPQTSATPSTVAACATAIAAQSCADFENGVLAAACVPPLGPRALGASCATGGQCQSTYCAISHGSACGRCAAPQAPGASCTDIGCNRGLTCVAATSTCQTPAGSAAPCDRTRPCGYGLSCVGAAADGGMSGRCQTGGAQVDVACHPRRQAAPECDRALGLYCEPSTHRCALLRGAADGESCGLASGGMEGACQGGALCVGSTARVAGHCVAPAAVGGLCDLDVGPPCLTPARCIVAGDGGTRGSCQVVDPATCG